MGIGIVEIGLLGLLLALLFGSRKLPALGADLANGIKEFRKTVGAQFAAKPAVGEDAPFEEAPAPARPSATAPADRR